MAGMQDLSRVGELEFEEVQELERQFSADLERVFEGREKEFGAHLRGMLFELWNQARGTKSDVVKELDELRELKNQRTELTALISSLFKNDEDIRQHIKQEATNVMGSLFWEHLNSHLSGGANDIALALALSRTLDLGEGLGGLLMPGSSRYTITNTGNAAVLPELDTTQPENDEVQKNLQARLRHEGLLPSEDFHESWKWAPVHLNTETGETFAFNHWNWRERYGPHPEEVRVPLAWDGCRWYFPNPRPVGDEGYYDVLTLYVDGVELDCTNYLSYQWEHEWDPLRVVNVIKSVWGIPEAGMGSEMVEAVFRHVEKTTVPY